jgi:hypothetical protein
VGEHSVVVIRWTNDKVEEIDYDDFAWLFPEELCSWLETNVFMKIQSFRVKGK